MIKFFAGDNSYELRKKLEAEVAAFTKEHGDLALERFEGDEVEPAVIAESAQSISFLASAKMVVVSNASNKDLIERLLELDVTESTHMIVVIQKLDKRASYYKKLQKHSGFTLFESIAPQRLPEWVAAQVKQEGGTISLSDARFLIDRVGGNQSTLGNEIQKLLLYNKNISKESIELLTDPLPQTTVFQLMDATFSGKLQEAMKIYAEQRAQKVEPHAIIGMIAWQLHVLALLKTAGDRSVDAIAKEAKVNPFVLRKSQSVARRTPMNNLKKFVADAAELDKAIKTTSIDADEAVKTYLVKLAIS